MMRCRAAIGALAVCGFATQVLAAPEVYTVEPAHTYPGFQALHHGISYWLGKFNKTSGKIWLDREGGTGRMEITVDTSSINFGFPMLDKIMLGEDYFDVAQYPTATYKSDSITFANGVPTAVDGQLTLRGVTKPVKLQILSFKCARNTLFGRDECGADVRGDFDRTQFGLTKSVEGDPTVRLIIQVEAIKGDTLPPMPPLPGMGKPPG
ncbi:MAG: polyisoprenoid-binding protein [Gammaproteobacteria bacterium]|nr:polyisoprenoid-binding protein [Gammaproteobacteria bacterium]